MRGGSTKKNSLLFLIALIVGLGVTYLAINQVYSTGNAFWFRRPVQCFDSDKGLNYSILGFLDYRSGRKFDYCSNNNTLVEGWCSSRGGPTFTRYNCPYGCRNGACLPQVNQTQACSDSDKGTDFFVKGSTRDLNQEGTDACLIGSGGGYTEVSECSGLNCYVHELYCMNLSSNSFCPPDCMNALTFACPNGCRDGACINNTGACTDSDGGINYSVKGTLKVATKYNKDFEIPDFCCATYEPNGVCGGGKEGRFLSEFYCNPDDPYDSYKNISTIYECPYGCYDGQCKAGSCIDECGSSGLKECLPLGNQSDYRTCGNFDSDPCLEWSYSNCSQGSRCENGSCIQSNTLDLGFLSDRIKVCDRNCDSLPVPVFKVCPTNYTNCSPKNYHFIELYLGNYPLLAFQTPMDVYREVAVQNGGKAYSYTKNFSLSLADGKGVVKQNSIGFSFDGTNKFLVYQDNFVDGSNPLVLWITGLEEILYKPENLTLKYEIVKKEGSKGSLRLIKKEEFKYDTNKLYSQVSEVTDSIDKLTGKDHVNFSIIYLPSPISSLLGGEGNFYMGNGGITVHYVENSLDNETAEIAHEYTHAIEEERGFFDNFKMDYGTVRGVPVCLHEGLADAVSVYLGYADEDRLKAGNQPEKGCVITNMDIPHTVGRCIFKYLRAEHIDSDSFYRSLFNPNHVYKFDSCDLNSRRGCDSYNILFSEASGQDLTQFMTQKIGGNCSSTLEEAKRNIGIV